MTKNVAPPKSTSGGGFLFEDKVCAWFVVQMLCGEAPLEPMLGVATRIDFQTRPDGWFLDDVLLTTNGQNGPHRFAWSIKSNTQFGTVSAPSDFVETVWAQYLHEGSGIFDGLRDYMGLVTTPLDVEFRASLEFVLTTANATSSDLLPGRYAQEGWASDARRSLFGSFHCPVDLANRKGVTGTDTGRLLNRLRFLQFDFDAQVSESEKRAVEACRRILRSGRYEDAQAMWHSILGITADYRTTAKGIDRQTLLQRLPARFGILELPDYRDDWNRLRSLTKANMALVRDTIGKEIRLQDADLRSALREALDDYDGAVLTGDSGVGKSAAVKAFAETLESSGEAVLWFNPSSFDKPDFAAFQSDLGLAYTLEELFGAVSSHTRLIVLDGFDRLYVPGAMRLVATLVRFVQGDEAATPWKTIVTCQTHDWPRLRNSLTDAGLPVSDWPCINVETWSADDLRPVWDAIPGTARLKSRKKLQSLWGNLKILDLLATRISAGNNVETSGWVGEADVAAWYWDSYVRSGDTPHARERFAMMLAEKEANELRSALPLDAFEIAELTPYESLRLDGVCQTTPEGRVRFAHDLFGDWGRLRILVSHADDFPRFIGTRINSPLWHRAIRLYGTYLLENGNDVDRWRSVRRVLNAEDNTIANDLLLEAAIFSADPSEILDKLKADLLAENGADLRRLLGRFLASATVPDIRYEADGQPLNPRLASRLRSPTWGDWPPMLGFLFRNRNDVVACAAEEVAKIADLWFRHTPEDFPFRKEMATIGLLLGEVAHRGWRDRTVHVARRKLLYRTALAGAAHYPDEVARFALKAAMRDGNEEDNDDVGDEMLPFGITFDSRYDPTAVPEEPWPDGPHGRVDDDFRDAILDEGALIPLMRIRPAVAREIILAVMLKKRQRFDWHNHAHHSHDLDLHHGDDWSIPLFTQGPFLSLLQCEFGEGLETIARLVDFASERWMYYTQLAAEEYRSQPAGADLGAMSAFLEDATRPPGKTALTLANETRLLLGDDRVYGWSGKNPPSAIGPALMALEKYFYNELDAGRPVAEKLDAVLQRTRSVALLKVLCDVGKREQSLFGTVLRPLLSVAELYLWDRRHGFHGRQHLLMFAFRQPRWFIEAAREFHNLPHRKIDIGALAVRIFVFDEAARSFLTQVRVKWQSIFPDISDQNMQEHFEEMIEAFDIDNYQISRDADGQLQVVNLRAYERNVAQQPEREAQLRKMRMMMLPVQARRYIDEGKRLSREELTDLWSLLDPLYQESVALSVDQSLPSEGEPRTEDAVVLSVARRLFSIITDWFKVVCRSVVNWVASRRNSTSQEFEEPEGAVPPKSAAQLEQENEEADMQMAAIALLFRQQGDWLDEYPERKQWCVERLAYAIHNPIQIRQFDVRDSVASWTWDCFAADLVAQLWLAEPDNRQYRYMLAKLFILAPHYTALNIIVSQCSEQRRSIRKDFARLRIFIFHVANMRARIQFVQQYSAYEKALSKEQVSSFQRSLDPWANHLVRRFVEGSLEVGNHVWSDMDSKADYLEVDAIRQHYLPHYMLDLELVRATHGWLPGLDEAIDDQERLEWVSFWRSALGFILHRVHTGRDDHKYPHEYERWILDGAGAVLAQMREAESPRSIWEPVLRLPADWHHWSEMVLESFHETGLSRDPAGAHFEATRTAMVEYVFEKSARSPGEGWSHDDDAWQALIGIDHINRRHWLVRHQTLAIRSLPQLRRWTEEIAGSSFSQMAALSEWLQLDCANPVRIDLMAEAYLAMDREGLLRVAPRRDSGNAIASLLHMAWERDEAALRANESAFKSFKEFLRWLVADQNAVALELARKVGSL